MSTPDPLYEQAKALVIEHQKCSVSLLQRRLQTGYTRSSQLVEQLIKGGVVGEFFDNSNFRTVLIPGITAGSTPSP